MLNNNATIAEIITALQGLQGLSVKGEFINTINGIITSNSDDIKKQLVATLNSKLGTSISNTAFWSSVISAVNGWVNPLASNKKWASGNISGNISGVKGVNNLAFTPSLVVLLGHSSSAMLPTEIASIAIMINNNLGQNYHLLLASGNTISAMSPFDSNTKFTSTGFQMSLYSFYYNWIAYE